MKSKLVALIISLTLLVGVWPVAAQIDWFEDEACWTLEQLQEMFFRNVNPTLHKPPFVEEPMVFFDFYALEIQGEEPPFPGFDNLVNKKGRGKPNFWRFFGAYVTEYPEGLLCLTRDDFDVAMALNGEMLLTLKFKMPSFRPGGK
jgi:hypothetical protein